MKITVITATTPPVPGRDVEGHYRRLRLLMSAIGGIADRVKAVHIVPDSVIQSAPPHAELAEIQSALWGCPVEINLIPRRTRTETFLEHYVKGVFSAGEQPALMGPCGPAQVSALARILSENSDLVFVHALAAMCAVLRTGNRTANIVFDLDDVAHRMRIRESLQLPLRKRELCLLAHAPALLHLERRAARRARLTFVASELDRRKLRRLGFGPGVTVVPNAVPLTREPPPLSAHPILLYIGDYGYDPNRVAAERLATRVFPLVRTGRPDAELFLVGKRAERLSEAARSQPGVSCLGFVDDLDELYAKTRVVCCPLSNGGGTRIKLIEAAGYARPMVATHVGAEGLAFEDGTEILLRDDDSGFAAACLDLLRDDALCGRLGAAARDKVMRLYDPPAVQRTVRTLLLETVNRPAANWAVSAT